MELADKVAGDATAVTQADIDRLRDLGLSDVEIFDVVATAAVRCFWSTALDALGVLPDASFAELEPGLRDALTVGRPISGRPRGEGAGISPGARVRRAVRGWGREDDHARQDGARGVPDRVRHVAARR